MSREVLDQIQSVAGAKIRVLRAGQGERLLYLHGTEGNPEWLPFQEILARRFEVWVPEHPGFGQSERPASLESMEDLTYFYLDLLDEIGPQPVHLVGHSIGGWLAAQIAVVYGHKLRSLTLIDSAGLNLKGHPMADLLAINDDEVDQLLVHKSPGLIERSPEQALQRGKHREMVARLAWTPYMHNPLLAKRLHRIQTPTLVIWGAEDRIIPPAYADAWALAIAGAKVARIPECGHTPQLEQPELVANQIVNFLSEGGAQR